MPNFQKYCGVEAITLQLHEYKLILFVLSYHFIIADYTI